MRGMKVFKFLALNLVLLVALFNFQNCGTDLGNPNVRAKLAFAPYNPDGTTEAAAWFHKLMPRANATVFHASGCLEKVTFMKYDERYVYINPNGDPSIDWDAASQIPSRERREIVPFFGQYLEFDPKGTPVKIEGLPLGRFVRISLYFNAFKCGDMAYTFTTQNSQGVFTNERFENSEGDDRKTIIFVQGDFTVDESTTGVIVNSQKLINYLNAAENDSDVIGNIRLQDLIETVSEN